MKYYQFTLPGYVAVLKFSLRKSSKHNGMEVATVRKGLHVIFVWAPRIIKEGNGLIKKQRCGDITHRRGIPGGEGSRLMERHKVISPTLTSVSSNVAQMFHVQQYPE